METETPAKLGDRIWREVSQSTSSDEITRGVSDLLAEYAEHDRFVLVRLDEQSRRVLVVGSTARDGDSDDGGEHTWTSESDSTFDDLVEWCSEGRTRVGAVSEIGGGFDHVCPWDPDAPALVVTLARDDGESGFAAARLTGREAADPERDFGVLSEPLAAALYYDRGMGDATAATVERPEARREHFQRVKRRELTDVIMDARTGLGDVVDWVRRVAPSREPILLIGEVGTGKQVIARTIHNNSTFSDGPMLRVNCGALSEGVVETKLFGTTEEEFTPATRREPGWFERARGGTLFLDEIDTLPDSAQRRIADWLDTGEIDRPDSSETFSAEVRLVAGNHTEVDASSDLVPELVDSLTTFPIHIPPLRARREDIPALAMQFADKIGRRIGGAPLALTADQIELLVEYDWPANIRELRSVIERAAIIGNGKRLHVEQALGTQIDGGSATDSDKIATLDEAVDRHLVRALRAAGGQVAGEDGAADLLDIHPSTLRSKLDRHDLDPADYR